MANKTDKGKPPTASVGTPICIAMIVCEKVLFDKDNVPSAIRIVDTITLRDIAPQPGDGLELPMLNLLIILKNGNASGRFKLLLLSSDPIKKKKPIGAAEVVVAGPPANGNNVCMPLRLVWAGPGLYWLELVHGKRLIAKTPVLIKLLAANQENESSKPKHKPYQKGVT